ncbi:hypothetical protein [Nonomuraea sp. NPDC049141]|uniref:hypothetical protein n=1 Tax=unclassified Nonomuraea TaxID=2593643 RepID=UPI0033CAFC83
MGGPTRPASGDDFTVVAELLTEHGFARRGNAGYRSVHWTSSRPDLPTLRVWIGLFQPSPGSPQGTDRPTIQTNDAHDNGGKGKGLRPPVHRPLPGAL